MNRIILRFTNNKSASTDMLGLEWEPALHRLLQLKQLNQPEHVIEQVEVAVYDAEFRDSWRYHRVNVDLGTWQYDPEEKKEPASGTECEQEDQGAEEDPTSKHQRPVLPGPVEPTTPTRDSAEQARGHAAIVGIEDAQRPSSPTTVQTRRSRRRTKPRG